MERNGSHSTRSANTTSSDFVLQWGNRKKLRCMKSQGKDQNDPSGSGQGHRRVERRVVRSDRNITKDPNSNGHLNLRQGSPSQRILRNSENSIGMRSNGTRGLASPDKKTGNNNNNNTHINIEKNNNHNENNNHRGGGGGGGGSGSSDNHDGKKSASSSGGDSLAAMWPPKFVIALTNKEKEEDFMLLKGSKPPQRPKKRAKFIQRTLNLVSPGAWLCDLTLERYEVREKKVTKKRPRGLKAMVNCIDSDSE